MSSLYTQAGKTFRERDLSVGKSTAAYHAAKRQQGICHALENLDQCEMQHGLIEQMATTATKTGWWNAQMASTSSTKWRRPRRGRPVQPVKPVKLQVPKPERIKPPEASPKMVQRPPSPLGLYDYGKMSLRSVSTDRLQPHLRNTRGPFANSSFAVAPFGGYPSTMQEPIMMQPELQPKKPYEGVVDTAPLTRAFSEAALMERLVPPPLPLVRSTRDQDLRSRAHASALTKATMEQQLDDQVSWSGQHGYSFKMTCDEYVRWLDEHGRCDDSAWLRAPRDSWTEGNFISYGVLSELHDVLIRRNMTIHGMFMFKDREETGNLEPWLFEDGLKRLGVRRAKNLSKEELAQLIRSVDTDSDGKISKTEVEVVLKRVANLQADERKLNRTRLPAV
eukprot:TRINITY_DN15580_c0_g1_i1.p1 TRINITY_DN15580_c0_g1~~TRINITY_DN15580_c0_g1_i1.p1  ORF type:complete len:392 (-),score=68.48 TRINITY_DN15580_c0_g1_i1:115-1290(-)